MRRMCSVLAISALAGSAGCGLLSRSETLTAEFEGRDCGLYEVDGSWLVYSWSPPNEQSRPVHLVARNLTTGQETELESDWYGSGLDVDGATLVYERRAPSGGDRAIVAYDLESQTSTTVVTGEVWEPQVSGETVVWVMRDAENSKRIAKGSTGGGYSAPINDPTRSQGVSDLRPRLSGNNLIFLRHDLSTRDYSIMHHDLSSGLTARLPVELPSITSIDVSGDKVAFSVPPENSLHVYDLSEKTNTRYGITPRKREGPVIRGDMVAWISHMPEDEFTPIAGQPLIDELDFRTLNVMDVKTGGVRTLAQDRFMLYRVRIGANADVFVGIPRSIDPGPGRITDIVRY